MHTISKWVVSSAVALSLMTPTILQSSTSASAAVWVETNKALPMNDPVTVYSSTSMKKKLGTISVNTTVTISNKGKKWSKLKFKGQRGYVLTSKLWFFQEREKPYASAVIIGKRLTENVNQIKAAETNGDVKQIAEKQYPSLEKGIKEMKEELARDGLTKAQIAKFKKDSLMPAEKLAKRMKPIAEAWNDYNAAKNEILNFEYEEARAMVDSAKAKIKVAMKGNAYAKKFVAAINEGTKDMERRFVYTTFDDLAYDNLGTKLVALTGQEKDVFNKKHANGFKSTKYGSYEYLFSFLNGRTGYKKMTFTMTAGAYWKNRKQDVDTLAEVYANAEKFSKVYTLISAKKSLQVTIDLQSINSNSSVYSHLIGSLDREIIISNIRLYR